MGNSQLSMSLDRKGASVASVRKIAANRANARLSTGPRSPAGKASVSRNALRHGLSLPVAADPQLRAQVERLMRRILGADDHPRLCELAAKAAEAQVALSRVRGKRAEVIRRELADGALAHTGSAVEVF